MYEASNQLRFGFANFPSFSGNIDSTMANLYFDDSGANGALTTRVIVGDSGGSASGPNFQTTGLTPPNVPGWATVDPVFSADSNLSAQARNPMPHNGVESNPEWVVLGYNYAAGESFDSIFDAMLAGDIRIAMHVIGITGGYSESILWTPIEPVIPPGPQDPPVVPVPGAAGLGLLGLGIVGFIRRRKSRAQD